MAIIHIATLKLSPRAYSRVHRMVHSMPFRQPVRRLTAWSRVIPPLELPFTHTYGRTFHPDRKREHYHALPPRKRLSSLFHHQLNIPTSIFINPSYPHTYPYPKFIFCTTVTSDLLGLPVAGNTRDTLACMAVMTQVRNVSKSSGYR